MCLAVPMRLVERQGTMGVVELEGVRREVHLGFIDDVQVGEYVLVHAGMAIEKLQAEQAEEDLALLRLLLDPPAGEDGATAAADDDGASAGEDRPS